MDFFGHVFMDGWMDFSLAIFYGWMDVFFIGNVFMDGWLYLLLAMFLWMDGCIFYWQCFYGWMDGWMDQLRKLQQLSLAASPTSVATTS